ncbi:MAG: hypothetical protein U0W40_15015 [Acidimicrobiia bacterium]
MCGAGGLVSPTSCSTTLRQDLTTIDRLVATEDRLAKRGRKGGAQFHQALERHDPTAALPESEPERMLARYLVESGLPAPVHQHVIRDRANRFVAQVDLAYPDHGIVIEFDSAPHHLARSPSNVTAPAAMR